MQSPLPTFRKLDVNSCEDIITPSDMRVIGYLRTRLKEVSSDEMLEWYKEISEPYIKAEASGRTVPDPTPDFSSVEMMTLVSGLLYPPSRAADRNGHDSGEFDMTTGLSTVRISEPLITAYPLFRHSFRMIRRHCQARDLTD